MIGPHGHNRRSLAAALLFHGSGSRGHEIRDENEQEQTVDNDANDGRCKDARSTVPGNAEQSHNAKDQTDDHEQEGNEFNHPRRSGDLFAGGEEDENQNRADPTQFSGLMGEGGGFWGQWGWCVHGCGWLIKK